MAKMLGNFELYKPSEFTFSNTSRWSAVFLAAASMTLCSSPRAAAQNPSDSSQEQTEPNPPQEPAQPQADQRRVISRDRMSQNNQSPQDMQDTDEPNRQNRPASPNRPARATATVPDATTIPAGKVIFVRLNEPLSSDHSHPGDTFTATLDQPTVITGWVV